MRFSSRRNFVRTVEYNGQTAVRKLFDSPDDWQAELSLLHLLKDHAAAPKVIQSIPGIILMEYLPYPTLLDELEHQERDSFDPAPWRALRTWLESVFAISGMLPSDGNLRNFLWDGSRIHGLDFEGYRSASLTETLAMIAAFILEYTPKDTFVKRQAAAILFPEDVSRFRHEIRERRSLKKASAPDASFILLAGGLSTRMGTDKASLPLLGSTLLELQLEKAQLLKIDDILVSGARNPVPGARIVPDIYPRRGPLGGLHACLKAARHPRCIVLSVDMPLIPPSLLRGLLSEHTGSRAEITLAVHGDRWQPLVGVYNSDLSGRIAPMIETSGAPVRALIEKSDCRYRQTLLPECFWANCNTPEAYLSIFNG